MKRLIANLLWKLSTTCRCKISNTLSFITPSSFSRSRTQTNLLLNRVMTRVRKSVHDGRMSKSNKMSKSYWMSFNKSLRIFPTSSSSPLICVSTFFLIQIHNLPSINTSLNSFYGSFFVPKKKNSATRLHIGPQTIFPSLFYSISKTSHSCKKVNKKLR